MGMSVPNTLIVPLLLNIRHHPIDPFPRLNRISYNSYKKNTIFQTFQTILLRSHFIPDEESHRSIEICE